VGARRDAHVEIAIGGNRLLVLANGLLHRFDRRSHRCEIDFGQFASGKGRDFPFDEPPGAEELEGALPFVDRSRRGPIGLGDENARADPHFHEPLNLERDERLANRRARYPELHREIALGWQALTPSELSRRDQHRQLIGNLSIEAAIIDGLNGHADSLPGHAACAYEKMSRLMPQFTPEPRVK